MSLPFGFATQSEMTPEQKKARESRRLRRSIQGGMNSGNVLGPMMGFMGLPWVSRGARNPGGSYGPPRWVMARDFFGGALGGWGGGGGRGGPKIEDPPLPPLDPNDPNDPNNPNGDGNPSGWSPIDLLYPPPIGTGAQWRNTMKYGA